jgi:hypothetical protein
VDENTPVEGASMQPGDSLCQPIIVERQRRKAEDARVRAQLRATLRWSRTTGIAVLAMVAFASLEYLGIIHQQPAPVWARAVFDGIAFALK